MRRGSYDVREGSVVTLGLHRDQAIGSASCFAHIAHLPLSLATAR